MKRFTPLLLFVVFFYACGDNDDARNDNDAADEPKRDTVDYRASVDQANKAFTEAALRGDSAAFVNDIYHPDANIMPPNTEAANVKTIAGMFSSMPKMGVKTFTLNTKELYEGDEVLTEVGTYEMGDGNKAVDEGKYIVIWKKDGDKWKLFRDIWNSDNAAPPAPAAKKK